MTYIVVAISGYLLLAVVLARGLFVHTLREYTAFYAYLGFVLVSSAVQLSVDVAFGYTSAEYRLAYELPTYIMPLLQLWVLWDVYRRIWENGNKPWRTWLRLFILAGILTSPIALGLPSQVIGTDFDKANQFFLIYHGLTLFLQMALCLLLVREVLLRADLDLGLNLKGILVGMSLLVGGQAVNFAGFIFAGGSSQVFWFLVQFIYFVALIVFTFSLWDYVPLRRVVRADQERVGKVNRDLSEVLKAVLFDRR